ncbi:MAG: biotin--[acetyl-CoA-carboxylase] ligase [Planctomycetota bacterium]|nr:biotin--[acetyl-CoA-carboxylase] ligase [Planctomycetota bacterium]
MAIVDRQRLLRRLAASRRLALDVQCLDRCDSTNDLARQRLSAGESMDGVLLLAHEQSGGRGRSARDWWSGPAGSNFALTLGLREPQLPPEVFGLLGAVALAESCTHVLDGGSAFATIAKSAKARVALKWPNDLLIDGAKISGFLCELPADAEETMLLGLGVNFHTSPPADVAKYPTTSLAAAAGGGGSTEVSLDGTDFLSSWLWKLEHGLRRYLLAGPEDFEREFLHLLRSWAPNGVRETRGGVEGPLLDFSVTRGLSWGDQEDPTTKPMGWISSLEALPPHAR